MRSVLALAVMATLACGTIGPARGTTLTVPELKFKVIDAAGTPAWCDPDYWPIVREGAEQENAKARYAEIKGDGETYAAIVAHEHLPSGELTDAQKLTLYRAWKLLIPVKLTRAGDAYAFDYKVQSASDYVQVRGTVSGDGLVTVVSQTPGSRPNCPICLAASTTVDTPAGPVRVTDVRVGTIVWTQDANGRRIAKPVAMVGSMVAPPGHRIVHLVLADGRELLVSPGHRTADGRALGGLRWGEALDGSTITRWELVPYDRDRTYDLLPGGPTGYYWANGILLASTLRAS
jgi:hypothetical protein